MNNDKSLLIKNLQYSDIQRAVKDEKYFAKILKANKGFIENAVFKTLNKNNKINDIEDLHSVGKFALWKAMTKFSDSKDGKSSFSTFVFVVIQNAVRQELKVLNKLKHNCISLESLLYYDYDLAGSQYNESVFNDPKNLFLKNSKNFEENILSKITFNDNINQLNEYEKYIFNLKYNDKKSIREISEILKINFHSFKQWYYKSIKIKFDKILAEI